MLQGRSSFVTPVSAIMTSKVITVEPRQSIRECMEIMTEKHLRHLPVLDEGRTVGLLSIGDVVKETMAEQDNLIQQLEQYIRGE
ncbi:CBS domain protein [compost metagenome]